MGLSRHRRVPFPRRPSLILRPTRALPFSTVPLPPCLAAAQSVSHGDRRSRGACISPPSPTRRDQSPSPAPREFWAAPLEGSNTDDARMSGDGIGEHLVGDKAIGAADRRRQAHVAGQPPLVCFAALAAVGCPRPGHGCRLSADAYRAAWHGSTCRDRVARARQMPTCAVDQPPLPIRHVAMGQGGRAAPGGRLGA